MPVGLAVPPARLDMNSVSRPTEPTAMVGLPESSLTQPARVRSESGNSGSQ